MEARDVAAYGYQVDSTMNKLIAAAILSIFITIPCAAGISPWFLLFLLVPVGIFVYVKRSGCDKPLLIASRYLILGDKIIYYKNVSRAQLNKENQTLTISTGRGTEVVISVDRFPTNARKPDKIRINKTAKFEKISEKIIEKLKTAAPDSVILS